MWNVCAFYRFLEIADCLGLQKALKAECERLGICGTILIAPEGINGTIAGEGNNLEKIMSFLDQKTEISKGEVKYSDASKKPFTRMKVRLKKEIITMKAPEADPTKNVGTYVSTDEWNDVISASDVVTLDTRNTYETRIGTFEGAIDPQTTSFTEFKDYVEKHLDPAKHKKVAMYCTGGIRCEKASSFMLAKGFETVYHLKGGILQYLEDISEDNSLWNGECFVFDKRVAVTHGLKEGEHGICYGCREPLAPEHLKSDAYEPGVSCPHCIDSLTPEKAERLRMRQSQINKSL